MRVEFRTVLKDIDGKDMEEPKRDPMGVVVTEGEGEEEKAVMAPVTLLRICKRALMATFEDEKKLDGVEKLKRWTLAQKINGGNTEVESEDVTMLKTLIGKGWGPGVVGPAYTILEGGE